MYKHDETALIINLMSAAYYISDGPKNEDDHRMSCELRDKLLKLIPAEKWEAIGEVCEDWIDTQLCVSGRTLDDAPEETSGHACDVAGVECVCDHEYNEQLDRT